MCTAQIGGCAVDQVGVCENFPKEEAFSMIYDLFLALLYVL